MDAIVEVGVATFGSGCEDKMSALPWNITPVPQLRKREVLRAPKEIFECCCVCGKLRKNSAGFKTSADGRPKTELGLQEPAWRGRYSDVSTYRVWVSSNLITNVYRGVFRRD
jgi:hypothetical protein